MPAVLTSWIRGGDPQRDGLVETRPIEEITADLAASIIGADFVAFDAKPSGPNVYLDRWPIYRNWLGEHPDVDWLWMVDASDVVMLREPWPHMTPGTLYVGCEPENILGHRWMLNHHPADFLQDFIRTHPGQLLNAGVIGGDRQTITEFLDALVDMIDQHGATLGLDMAPVNFVAYNTFGERLITGDQVVTTFKAYADNGVAWWQHK